MSDERFEDSRSGVDAFHFAVTFAGFCVAVGGAVISSPHIACGGLIVLAWGLAYFAVNNGYN